MHVLREFCLKWGHDGELLADEDFGEEFHGSGEDHGLLFEVFGLLGEQFAGARENGWFVRKLVRRGGS